MNTYRLVLHVDRVDGSLGVALGNACNFAAELEGEEIRMVLVVNSRAVTELTKHNTGIAGQLEKAHALGLDIRVCSNSLRGTGTDPQALFPQCTVVPAGIVELVNLQRAGYAYVKP